jgi:Flp pilus assembly protein TadD
MRKLLGLWCAAIAITLAQTGNLLEQADAAFRSGDLDRAAALAGQAVKSDPNAVHGYLILGVVAAERRQWEAANRNFQRVIKLDPNNPFGHFYLGQASLYQHNWTQAVRYFTEAQKRGYPERERLGIELAFALNEAGRPKEALAGLQRIPPPAGGPLAAQYHATTAFALGRLNQPAPAIEAIRRARDLEDTKPEYWNFLTSTLIDTDQTTFALAEAIRAQRRFPDDPDTQFLFALASFYVTESPLSNLALRNLREAEPESPRVLLAEGLLYRKQGETEPATQAFRRAAEKGVRDAHLLLGILLKEAGDYAGAEREFREAEKENPHNGQTLLELGKLVLARGELPEALSLLERAGYLMPNTSAVQYQLGLAFGRLGRKDQAEQHMNRWRELEKQQAELLRKTPAP